MRAVIYARYSSDLQREASIEDQVRLCKERIQHEGWQLVAKYADRAISGASVLRPGYQQMLDDVRAGAFDIVVAEALDRLSRDQESVAGLYKQLSFAGVRLFTITEGDINELHVGLKGTMNALFLKDLVVKIRRGQRGSIERGRSAGGIGFGYDVVREMDTRGEPLRGGRAINEARAALIRRIFREFAAGCSPRAIAKRLNKERVPGPSGKPWSPSSIYGNWRRGTGVLNNELYRGCLVWNRQRFVRDPSTGRRQARYNPPETWISIDVPHLRIIDEGLWQRVKARQDQLRDTALPQLSTRRTCDARRPRYLLSSLVRCGSCGSRYVVVSQTHMACAAARDRGTCDNHLRIHRPTLERSVLDGLKAHMLQPDLLKVFIREFNIELGKLGAATNRDRQVWLDELARIDHGIRQIIEAVKSGFRSPAMATELASLEVRKKKLEAQLQERPKSMPRLHPSLGAAYRDKVADLHGALDREDSRAEAVEILRQLIEEIRLIPLVGRLEIELHGNLASILQFAQNKQPGAVNTGMRIKMVAEEGFEPPTRGL